MTNIVLALGLAAVSMSTAQAGDVLLLKTGQVRIEDQSIRLLTETLANRSAARSELRHFVVQFEGVITPAIEKELIARGLEPIRYLPNDALIVRGRAQGASLLSSSASARMRALTSVPAEWKLDPLLAQVEGRGTRFIVTAYDLDETSTMMRALRLVPDVRFVGQSGRDVFVEAPFARLREIAALEPVEWIQELPVMVTFGFQPLDENTTAEPTPLPEYTGYESGTKIMGFDAAWSRGFHGENQVVAAADTGLDTGDRSTLHSDHHAAFQEGIIMGLLGETWGDPQGHGTHVMGSIVGSGAHSNGLFKGGAHGAKLVAEGMWSAVLNNLAPPTDFSKLVGQPYGAGARIHTNSWGNPRSLGEYDTFAIRADEFMWNNPDMLILFAAGNSGEDANKDGRIDEGSVSSPSTAKNVLTVGASENLLAEGGIQKAHGELRDGNNKWGVEPIKSDRLSDNPSGIAAFSSRGPTRDGRMKPEIVAPGTNIVSTRSKFEGATALWGAYGDHYAYAGGTSMATPLAAGAAAVARQYLIQAHSVSSPTAALVKGLLIHTARDLFPGQYGRGETQELQMPRPNVHEGYGRVDVDRLTTSANDSIVVDERVGVATGEENFIDVQLRGGAELRVTLSYTDAPGAPNSAKALVNDLDLKLVKPDGTTLKSSDHVNNTEMLELKDVEAGTYRVVVQGAHVPRGKAGKQPYALVITR